ncbi:MAG: hypothetical protein Fues2KO_10560 [Fuerstiella sp.]
MAFHRAVILPSRRYYDYDVRCHEKSDVGVRQLLTAELRFLTSSGDLEPIREPPGAATFVFAFRTRSEEEATNVGDDEGRRLGRKHKRPEGLCRQQPICGVIAP